MSKRFELHNLLCEIINIEETNGDRHVYFQPPASVQMKYPAIRYSLSDLEINHANNKVYKQMTAYELILIDKDSDSSYIDKIMQLAYCSFDRFYTSDNLNHYVFTIYY